jgi:hypothetical protein
MLGVGRKLGPSLSHAEERCAELGCFRSFSEAEACTGMPSAGHWIGGHVILLWLPLTVPHSIPDCGSSQAGCRAVQRSQEQTARRLAAASIS